MSTSPPSSAVVLKIAPGPYSARVRAAAPGAAPARQEPVSPIERPERPQQRDPSPWQPVKVGVSDERTPHSQAGQQERPDRAVRPERLLPSHPEGGGAAPFWVQMWSQSPGTDAASLQGRPGAALMGSDAYRAAGAEPPVYSEAPSVFRLTV